LPNPLTTPARRGSYVQNYGALCHDIHAACQNALRWKITGDTAHVGTAFMPSWTGGSSRPVHPQVATKTIGAKTARSSHHLDGQHPQTRHQLSPERRAHLDAFGKRW
jgi:hypothetical protein